MAGLCGVEVLLLWAGVTLANITPPPLCSYTVTPIKFGLQIDITGSPPGFYTIKIKEEGQHETGKTFNVDFGQTSSHDITHLKPCTEYEHYVIFNDGTDGQRPCSNTEHETRAKSMSFLNQSEIHSIVQPKLPAEINTTLPSQCQLTTDYTCQENGQIKKLSELEPFTDYSCIGHVKDNNNSIIINSTDIPVRINCDLQIINMKTTVTNTSIHLSWTTTSTNCQDVLPTLPKLSYDCSCSPAHNTLELIVFKDPPGGTCEIKGLQPYTNHTCTVKPKYNNNPEGSSAEVTLKTETGIPDAVDYLSMYSPENNVIKADCYYRGRFNGPDQKFIARLYASDDPQTLLKEETEKNCYFVFKDLSSTTYRVEVTVFNGEYESSPIIRNDDAIYNTNTHVFIVRLCFVAIGIIIMITFAVIYNRKSKDDVTVDVRLQSTAVYVNEEHPGLRKRA